MSASKKWRNECLESMRTSYPLTEEMQDDFYDAVVCNRDSRHRYWGLWHDDKFVGCGGITNIQWENRIGEISLIIDPELRRKGIGKLAVDALLRTAFLELSLETVFGECYMSCPERVEFWKKVTKKYEGYETLLPKRKYWDGKFFSSYYFSIGALTIYKTMD